MRGWLVVLLAACGRIGFDPIAGEFAGVTRLATGHDHACMLRDGELYCWGRNDSSQLGLGAVTGDQTAPMQVAPQTRWVDVVAGADMTCALDDTGVVWCWGSGIEGRLGLGTDTSPTATEPTPHPEARRYRSLWGGREHTCAIGDGADAGTLWCWGRNGAMQLGNGTSQATGTPTQPTFAVADPVRDRMWRSLGTGSDHTCAVQEDDTLWCWGSNGSGQLGQAGGAAMRDHPNLVTVTVAGQTLTWSVVTSGLDASCALSRDGRLVCWGRNNSGQLGLGSSTLMGEPPTPATAPVGIAEIVFGDELMCVRQDTTVSCAGRNEDGELGRGFESPIETVLMPARGAWTQIEAGNDFACAVDALGEAWCWGADDRGQLGNGGSLGDPSSSDPVRVTLSATN